MWYSKFKLSHSGLNETLRQRNKMKNLKMNSLECRNTFCFETVKIVSHDDNSLVIECPKCKNTHGQRVWSEDWFESNEKIAELMDTQ